MLNHRAGAVDRRTLFIGSDQKGNAAVVLWMIRDKAFNGGQHGSEAAFHIGSATPAQHSLCVDAGLERGVLPVDIGAAGHHIGVARESHDGAVMTAHCPKILYIAKGQPLNIETERC